MPFVHPRPSPWLPVIIWRCLQWVTLFIALVTALLVFLFPHPGLTIFWSIIVPVLPLLFFVAPGIWRNICPMATLNELPIRLKISKNKTHANRWRALSYMVGVVVLLVCVSSRKWLFDESGIATAGLILFGLISAFMGGLFFKGMSGWCSSICPILSVERLYGQTPFKQVGSIHCHPCVGCVKNCFDLNPMTASLEDQYDHDDRYVRQRHIFAGLFPGFILAFFTASPADGFVWLYAHFIIYSGFSLALFYTLNRCYRGRKNRVSLLFAAAAINTYYWFASVGFFSHLSNLLGQDMWPLAPWALRSFLLVLTLIWVLRSWAIEDRFLRGKHLA